MGDMQGNLQVIPFFVFRYLYLASIHLKCGTFCLTQPKLNVPHWDPATPACSERCEAVKKRRGRSLPSRQRMGDRQGNLQVIPFFVFRYLSRGGWRGYYDLLNSSLSYLALPKRLREDEVAQ